MICLKKNKCPNGCGTYINSVEKGNVHLAECKKCNTCLHIFNHLDYHDC